MKKLTAALLSGLALSAAGFTLNKQSVAKPVVAPLTGHQRMQATVALPVGTTPNKAVAKHKTIGGCNIYLWGQPAQYSSGSLKCGFLSAVCAVIKCTTSPTVYAVSVYEGENSEKPTVSFNARSDYEEQDTDEGTLYTFTEVEGQP